MFLFDSRFSFIACCCQICVIMWKALRLGVMGLLRLPYCLWMSLRIWQHLRQSIFYDILQYSIQAQSNQKHISINLIFLKALKDLVIILRGLKRCNCIQDVQTPQYIISMSQYTACLHVYMLARLAPHPLDLRQSREENRHFIQLASDTPCDGIDIEQVRSPLQDLGVIMEEDTNHPIHHLTMSSSFLQQHPEPILNYHLTIPLPQRKLKSYVYTFSLPQILSEDGDQPYQMTSQQFFGEDCHEQLRLAIVHSRQQLTYDEIIRLAAPKETVEMHSKLRINTTEESSYSSRPKKYQVFKKQNTSKSGLSGLSLRSGKPVSKQSSHISMTSSSKPQRSRMTRSVLRARSRLIEQEEQVDPYTLLNTAGSCIFYVFMLLMVGLSVWLMHPLSRT